MEKKIWDKALISLTPGGSEFVDDPQRCVEFIKEVQKSMKRTIISQKKELDKLEVALRRIRSYTQGSITTSEIQINLLATEVLTTTLEPSKQ